VGDTATSGDEAALPDGVGEAGGSGDTEMTAEGPAEPVGDVTVFEHADRMSARPTSSVPAVTRGISYPQSFGHPRCL
jgi:hypothetical protein